MIVAKTSRLNVPAKDLLSSILYARAARWPPPFFPCNSPDERYFHGIALNIYHALFSSFYELRRLCVAI